MSWSRLPSLLTSPCSEARRACRRRVVGRRCDGRDAGRCRHAGTSTSLTCAPISSATSRATAYLATLENIFVYLGTPGHEIVRVYSVTLVEPEFYERDEIDRLDETRAVRTIWKPLDGFLSGSERLYPEGIVELLATVPALLDPARDQHVAVDAEQILAVETRLLDLAAQGANRLRFPRESPSSRAFNGSRGRAGGRTLPPALSVS